MRTNDLYAHDPKPPAVETMVSDKPKLPLPGWYWAYRQQGVWTVVLLQSNMMVWDITMNISPLSSWTLGPSIPTPTTTTTPN